MRYGWAFIVLLAGCAQAPIGMRYANPNCILRCVVEVIEVQDNPMLTTLTPSIGAGTGGDVTRTKTSTETEVVPPP